MAKYQLRFYKYEDGRTQQDVAAYGVIDFENVGDPNTNRSSKGHIKISDKRHSGSTESTSVEGTYWKARKEGGQTTPIPYFVTLAGSDDDVQDAYLSLMVSSESTGTPAFWSIAGQAKFRVSKFDLDGSFQVIGELA